VELSKKGNKVYFLNPPGKVNSLTDIHKDLWVVNYKPSFRGLRILPGYMSGFLVKKEIEKLEKWINVKFDIIWNFDSSRFFNLSQIKNKLKIAHIVDWSENFNRKLLSKTSDIGFCTSRFLEEDMKKYNPHTFNIGHGYSTSDYKLNEEELDQLNDKYKIKVGYVGNLSIRYIDWKLIYILLTENPAIGFYFIGPEGKSNLSGNFIIDPHYKKVKECENAIFLGEIQSKKIPAFLKCFDILLLIYKDYISVFQLANPHKMLEYLGSGKVIVSTYTEEYKDNNGLIEMIEENKYLQKKFMEVLNNLNYYNSDNLKMKRIQYALQETYCEKIKRIEELLNIVK
jgi:hypothetical protein